MDDTSARPRFGEPREPKNRVDPGSRLAGMIDFVAASHARATAFLLLCAMLFFLPGFFTIPPIDRDEARFAQATKQMVESGDFVDIRFQDDVRYKKPVGIYWMQAAAVQTASALGLARPQVRIWIYRVPSLIGAIGAVLLTYWTALAFVTRRGAILAALIRFVWPGPIPSVIPSSATTIALDLTCLTTFIANLRSSSSLSVGAFLVTTRSSPSSYSSASISWTRMPPSTFFMSMLPAGGCFSMAASFSSRIFCFCESIANASSVKPGAITISTKIFDISSAVSLSIIRFAATMPPKIDTGSAS
jgi:hypothetical protein